MGSRSRSKAVSTGLLMTIVATMIMLSLTREALAFSPAALTVGSSSSIGGARRDLQQQSTAFTTNSNSRKRSRRRTSIFVSTPDEEDDTENTNEGNNDQANKLQQQAEQLRQQIRDMEASLGDSRKRNYEPPTATIDPQDADDGPMSLRGKTILVAGANGRLGSMVCRYLLRNHPQTKVVAACHIVSQDSPTARGYGRLAYEVGAEDGVGTLGAAWSEERNASFQWYEGMRDYNLQNLRIVECELLDPVQCRTVTDGVDAVLWCATDYNGNQPRAVSGLNFAFLFRAVAAPARGRVEIEGLQNMLGALKQERVERRNAMSAMSNSNKNKPTNDPINFVLVSPAPQALPDFETPFGAFLGIKRQGEQMMQTDFPSLTSVALQMGKYEDNFVQEDLELLYDETPQQDVTQMDNNQLRRRINRRDAARAVVDALTQPEWVGKVVQVWTVS